MSTRANLCINNIWYAIRSDGYPSYVIDKILIPLIKDAKEKDERNPDFSYNTIISLLLEEYDIREGAVSGYNYEYEIDKGGKIFWKIWDGDWKDASKREWEKVK